MYDHFTENHGKPSRIGAVILDTLLVLKQVPNWQDLKAEIIQ